LPFQGLSLPILPPPLIQEILPDCGDNSYQEIVRQVVIHSYPIIDDHNHLRNSPDTFELQRSNYPFRREFPAYTVKIDKADQKVVEIIEGLGFVVKRKLREQ